MLRLVWTAGPAGGDPAGFALLSEVPGWIEDVRSRGARAVSLLGVRAAVPWLLPGVKSTSYAVNMAAEAEAKRRGADEAVFVDAEGVVLEGTVTNVWWRSGETLVTPSLELGILAGVTRAALLELAGALGYAVEEGAYPLGDLYDADEAFTSSSVREVMPLVEVDGRPLGRGPASGELQEALRAAAVADTGQRHAGSRAGGGGLAGTLFGVAKETVRLGGMALQNGVLVHGPTAWGAAVRGGDGTLHVASGKKPRFAESVHDARSARPAPTCRGVRAPPGRPPRASAGALPVRAAGRAGIDGRVLARHARACADPGARPAGASSWPGRSRSLLPCSRSAGPTSPSTTAPSTSPSARTRTGESEPRRSIRAAARS